MRQTKTVQLDGLTVEVRELTVAEVRTVLNGYFDRMVHADPDAFDSVGALLLPLPLDDFPAFCSLTAEDAQALYPSQLQKVYAAMKELNPDFFGMLDRLLNR